MKVGVIGAGAVGAACVVALVMRNCVRELVVLDRDAKRAKGVATDVQYGATLSSMIDVSAGDYPELANADVVVVTAGINEKAGGATDRSDPNGRLRLLGTNAKVYEDIIPKIVKVAPKAMILVVTDPPDPLAYLARKLAGHDRVLSAGTFLDSLRFRQHVARHLKVNPLSVDAQVIGEHGTSSVFLWSSVTVGGESLQNILKQKNENFDAVKKQIEQEVRYANITIIEGINASQYGIGMVTARIVEILLRDEKMVIPIGSYQSQYDATFSLPSTLGKNGISQVFNVPLSSDEETSLQKCIEVLKKAQAGI